MKRILLFVLVLSSCKTLPVPVLDDAIDSAAGTTASIEEAKASAQSLSDDLEPLTIPVEIKEKARALVASIGEAEERAASTEAAIANVATEVRAVVAERDEAVTKVRAAQELNFKLLAALACALALLTLPFLLRRR